EDKHRAVEPHQHDRQPGPDQGQALRAFEGYQSGALAYPAEPSQQVRPRAKESAGGGDVDDRDAEERRRAGQQPEGEPDWDAESCSGERVRPRPTEAVIKDVRGSAQREPKRRGDESAQAALNHSSEQGLLNRSVDCVEPGLKPGVAGPGRDAEPSAPGREPSLTQSAGSER